MHPHRFYKRYTDVFPADTKCLEQRICVTFPFFWKQSISGRDIFTLDEILKMCEKLNFGVVVWKRTSVLRYGNRLVPDLRFLLCSNLP